MAVTAGDLEATAHALGFRAELVEKSTRLLRILDKIGAHPYLGERLALKGGTALNLFLFSAPRLSLDIDLNYVGAAHRETTLAERPLVEAALEALFADDGLTVKRIPRAHAGGKWRLGYLDAWGRSAGLEVDLNFMYRIPLWPTTRRDSYQLGRWGASHVQLVEIHELAAGKLSALLARSAPRDLFDSKLIAGFRDLDLDRLGIAFVVYGAMDRRDWRTVSESDVRCDPRQLAQHLVPTLPLDVARAAPSSEAYARAPAEECPRILSMVLPFSTAEKAFLDQLLDYGQIRADLLTDDDVLRQRIQAQPLLAWKALNVRKHKGRAP